MMKNITNSDFAEVANVVRQHGDEGMKISEVVDTLVRRHHIDPSRARFVVRVALDKGRVRTDRNFRLHLTVPG